MRILGLDVGTAITGWAIIDRKSRNSLSLIKSGAIITSPKEHMSRRLLQIHQEVGKILKELNPAEIAIESVYFFKNQKTVIPVAQARGVLTLACAQAGITPVDYTPLQVKTAVTGYGRADKAQVQRLVKLIFRLKEVPKPDDIADAIAVAYCHANSL